MMHGVVRVVFTREMRWRVREDTKYGERRKERRRESESTEGKIDRSHLFFVVVLVVNKPRLLPIRGPIGFFTGSLPGCCRDAAISIHKNCYGRGT